MFTLTWFFEDGKEGYCSGTLDSLSTVKFALRQYWPSLKFLLVNNRGSQIPVLWLENSEIKDS